jgi:predicted heme/steroid binding protein
MNLSELQQFNGENNNKIYIGCMGFVFDMTGSGNKKKKK